MPLRLVWCFLFVTASAVGAGQQPGISVSAGQSSARRLAAKDTPRALRLPAVRPIGSPEPGGKARFRYTFDLTEAPRMVRLTVLSRSPFVACINGFRALAGAGGDKPEVVYITRRVAQGRTLLAIEADEPDAEPRPDGIGFEVKVVDPKGATRRLYSDRGVRASWRAPSGWQQPGFDDRRWPAAQAIGRPVVQARVPDTGTRAPAGHIGSGGPVRQPGVPNHPITRSPNDAVTQPSNRPIPQPPNRATLPSLDYSRLIRVWDIAGDRPEENPYTRPRDVGERMLLTTSVGTPAEMAVMASAGFTLFQTDSDHLSTEETAPGVWDYHTPDAALRSVKERGMDWCYFPHFAFPPKWYRDSVPFTRITCLEHNQPAQAFSPWDPKFALSVSRGYQALAAHYAPARTPAHPSISALYLGVHGDYGECGLLMGARTSAPGQREDWQKRFGNLHDHLDWWCADPLARAAFREAMMRKYRDLDVLNAAWHTSLRRPSEIAYPKSPKGVARRCWLDFVEWYLNSVSSLTDTVSRVARSRFPDSLLMLPVGFGDENPRGGNDNSEIPKIAARYRVDVRSTHGGFKPFADNQATMLGRIASACRFYGVPLWTEPPGGISPERAVDRIFSAASLGCKGFFDWGGNVVQNRDVYYRYGKYLKVGKPIVDVAMFYPTTSHLLQPDVGYPPTLEKGCADIRDVLNYDTLDERMIQDGALDRYRVLVMWEGTVVESAVLARIRDWVERGGVLAAYDFGKIETVEGDRSWFGDLFGYAGKLTPAVVGRRYVSDSGGAPPARYRVSVGLPAGARCLSGDWLDPEITSGVARRWSGANGEVILPLDPSADHTLVIRASFPPESAGLKREVLVNGQVLGQIDRAAETTYRFRMPASMLRGETAVVAIRSQTFVPANIMPGSADRRSLGAYVTYVQVDPADSSVSVDAPELAGHLETTIDYRRLRNEWAHPVGRGWTVYFPSTRRNLAGYYEVVRYLAYHLSDLDPTKQDAIAVDDSWDGVYATLLSDRALYYNPTAQTVTRTIVMSPQAFAGADGVEPPDAFTHTIKLEPNSIDDIPFGPPIQEMLLQCEKFTMLGALRPTSGPGFNPSAGPNEVLLPVGGQISTRFRCEVAGRYHVYYRAWRRSAQARAEILVDDARLQAGAAPAGPAAHRETELAGSVELKPGVHSLTLRPLRGQDVRADFVVLTTDPTIAGYSFAVHK